jgi:ribonuclease I
MALPWVRLDSNIHAHDKILSLLDDSNRSKWQAFALYVFALGWSGGQETDGRIPRSALKMLHGSTQTARLLVVHRLWIETVDGWEIVNYSTRQQLSDETYSVRKAQVIGGQKGACVRHHGPDCGCWRRTG